MPPRRSWRLVPNLGALNLETFAWGGAGRKESACGRRRSRRREEPTIELEGPTYVKGFRGVQAVPDSCSVLQRKVRKK